MRPIDADWLLDFIKFDERVIAPEEHEAEDIVMMIQTAPTITPPPNDPLTMEELREMEGKPLPVWCDKVNGYIFIAVTKMEPHNKVWFFNHTGNLDTILYYITKFYRRKPEEEAT